MPKIPDWAWLWAALKPPKPRPLVTTTRLPYTETVVQQFGREWLADNAIRDYGPMYPGLTGSVVWEGNTLILCWQA